MLPLQFAILRTRKFLLCNPRAQSKPGECRADTPEGGIMVDGKRPPIVIWIIPLLTGVAGFYRVTQSPSFKMYRAVDIVQLLGSGVCFGVAMVGMIFMLRGTRP